MEEALSPRADHVETRVQLGFRGSHGGGRKFGVHRKVRLRTVGALVSGRATALRLLDAARVQAQFGRKNGLR